MHMIRALAALLRLPLCALIAFGVGGVARAAPLDVFFLAVGSSNYAAPAGADQTGLPDIYGANNGARRFADLLQRGGASRGIVLTSEEGNFVSLGDVREGLRRITSDLAKVQAANPLFVFYFGGHGMSEGVAWNLFALPGTFTYRGKPEALPVSALAKQALHAATVADELDKLRVPYLVLWDTCYEGSARSFDYSVLTRTASQNLTDVAKALRFLNEFHQSSPVMFSTDPGSVVKVVPDPRDGTRNVGPLARRAMLAVDGARADRRTLTLEAFIGLMTNPGLDSTTKPAVTFAEYSQYWRDDFVRPQERSGEVEAMLGTGRSADVCCVPSTEMPVPTRSFRGELKLSGGSGEYITQGRSIVLVGSKVTSTVTEQRDRSLDIQFESDGTSWEVELAAPDGQRLAPKKYEHAQRAGFAEAGHPGLAVSGDARGCNDVTGSFTVDEVDYDAEGRVSRLSARFIQLCDDIRVPLNGTLRLFPQ
jgi:hypothetical protein